MAFKYYAALKESDAAQTLPFPMTLHNNNAVTVDLTITPDGAGLLFSAFTASTDLTDAVQTLPTMPAAVSLTNYATTTLGLGSGATINVTVGNTATGILTGLDTASVTGTPVEAAEFLYTPTSGGAGEGFTCTFAVNAAAELINVIIVTAGTGYTAGQTLTWAENGQSITWTLIQGDLQVPVYKPTVVAIQNVGDNYRVNDVITAVIEDEEDPVNSYTININVLIGSLSTTTIVYRLPQDHTTPFRGSNFTVMGITDRSILAQS